jgi:hypothetical protein
LARTRADRANAVFLLTSSTTHEQPRELDKKISLYMVLVKRYAKLLHYTDTHTHACTQSSIHIVYTNRFLKHNCATDGPVYVSSFSRKACRRCAR